MLCKCFLLYTGSMKINNDIFLVKLLKNNCEIQNEQQKRVQLIIINWGIKKINIFQCYLVEVNWVKLVPTKNVCSNCHDNFVRVFSFQWPWTWNDKSKWEREKEKRWGKEGGRKERDRIVRRKKERDKHRKRELREW